MTPKNKFNEVLYIQERFPVYQNVLYDSKSEAMSCPTSNIKIVVDKKTGLVFNSEFDPKLIKYDKRYNNEQSYSNVFKNHLHDVCRIIKKFFPLDNIVEIGCGKGTFLKMLSSYGFDICGYDPAYEGKCPKIKKSYYPFTNKTYKGIILRHVLEHIFNPLEFLNNLKKSNPNSLIYIEVPCFDWICNHRAWYDIYYEHVNYFRLSDFHRMFKDIKESGTLFNGQYIYCVANINSFVFPTLTSATPITFPTDFTIRIKELAKKLSDPITIWGAGSKGVIFTLLMERAGRTVENVIDINPAKIGKFLPLTGVTVRSPSDVISRLAKNETILVMNSNYLPEVISASHGYFNYICIDKY